MPLTGVLLVLVLAMSAGAQGQDFNVDFSVPHSAVPPATFGAAGQPGIWNGIAPQPGGPPVPLVDVNGNASSVTVQIPLYGSGVGSPLSDPSLPADVNNLFEDGIAAGDLPESLLVEGLGTAVYDVILYGYVPTHLNWETWFLGPGGQQITQTFPWSGFQLGITHVRARQSFPGGSMPVYWANPTGIGVGQYGWFSGMQIERVWKDLGNGLAGSSGIPVLRGLGTFKSGSTNTLAVSGARASSPAFLVFGLSELNLPLLGGVMVPAMDFILTGQKTNAAGQLDLSGTLPAIPSGTLVVCQAWIFDPAGPKGLAASNGLAVKAF